MCVSLACIISSWDKTGAPSPKLFTDPAAPLVSLFQAALRQFRLPFFPALANFGSYSSLLCPACSVLRRSTCPAICTSA